MKIGNEEQASQVVHDFWTALAEKNWDKLKTLFADEFEAYWPQSKELFKSADAFIEMNRAYPGTHKFEFYNSSHSYDQWEHRDHYTSEVKITSEMPDGKTMNLFAISYFEIEEGLIVSMREYWAECYAAPDWRKHLVEVQKL
jgi:ketosteroid isomerase-like protein